MHYLGCATSDYRYWSVSSVLIHDVILLCKLNQIQDSQQEGQSEGHLWFIIIIGQIVVEIKVA